MTLPHPSLEALAPFVNRERERGTLKSLFDKTVAGHGCTVLLAGEAGIGKTRLVGEFSQEVRSAGSMFVEGATFEQEGSIPYSPWVEIIQQLLKKIPAATFRKTPEWVISEIGVIVPQILSQARGLGLKAWLKGPRSTSTLLPAADQDRIRLFQAISELLSLVEDKGLVVFLDDLVWADPLSLQMFHYLTRRAGERRMMLIGAYRDLELRDDHPLAVMVRDLSRHRASHHLAIGRFTDEHVSSLLTKQLGGPVSKELSQLIFSRTSGNPFFVEEVVRSLVERGLLAKSGEGWTVSGEKQVEIPSSIRTIIKQRTSRLSEECVQLLSIASLVGMEFDFDILRRASGFPEEESMALLESAVKLRLVHERRVASKVLYYFADEQVLEFFREQLSLLRARKYHAAIGRAMEEVYGSRIEDRVGELAYHFVEGASADKAREYSIRAGDRSDKLYGQSDARRHWTNALELIPENDLEGRLSLLNKLAWSAFSQSKRSEALRFCERGIEIAEQLGALTKVADLYTLQGVTQFLLAGSKEKALDSYRRGLKALEQQPGTRQQANLLQETARIYALTGEGERLGTPELEKAIELSSKLKAYDVLAQCYLTLALTLPLSKKEEIFAYQEKALKLGQEHDIPEAVMRAANNLGLNHGWMKADYKRAEELMLKGLDVAEKIGAVDYILFLKGGLAMEVYTPAGKWEKAQKLADDSIELIRDVSEISERYPIAFHNTLSVILGARGEYQKAEELSNEAVSSSEKIGWSDFLAYSHGVRGALYLAQEMLEKAERDLLDSWKFAKQSPFDVSMIATLFMLVQLSLKRGRKEDAASLYQELHKVVLALDENWAEAYDTWAEGLLAEAKGEPSSSMSLLEESVLRWKKVERPYELARVHRDLARVQEKTGRNAEAENSLTAARRIFTQLGIPAMLIDRVA